MWQPNPIGMTNFRHERKRFGIKPDDRRRHLYVIGKTGVGKTTLLLNMAIADIRNHEGMAVVDPHGEFAEKLLDYIPEDRIKDVVYFNPADTEHPIGFNPLEETDQESRHLLSSSIMAVFKKIWTDAWSARMQYILTNTLLALLENPGTTLLQIMRMLNDKDYRGAIVERLSDPVVKSFWVKGFARYSEQFETEATAAIQNKIGQFVTNPLMRNILGQRRSSFKMGELMDNGKILITNLSKGKIGEDNSALLGALIVTKLQLAAMSRVRILEEERRDFYLYVDEFQNFATDSFGTILSEARKYRLCLTLAHQYIQQLTEEGTTKVRDAVFGNVGTIVSFRVGAPDAEFLEKEFEPEFTRSDLQNLANHSIYLKLMIDGRTSPAFSAETLPLEAQPVSGLRDLIIQNTRNHYARPRKTVELVIEKDYLEPFHSGAQREGSHDREELARERGDTTSGELGSEARGKERHQGRAERQSLQESALNHGLDKALQAQRSDEREDDGHRA